MDLKNYKACVPSGVTAITNCGPFQKCYSYKQEYATLNATLDSLYSEKGGFCDCYSTYGYGGDTYPDCNRLSSSSVPTLIGLGVIPFILCFFLLVIVINMGRQLKAADSTTRNAKKKKRKNKVIKRGGFALLLSSIFFLVLIASTILSVIDPLLTSRNAFFDYGFRISLSAYSFFAVPALYIVPICWIETILSSRKLKIKTSYVKGKRILVAGQFFVCLLVGVNSGLGWFKGVQYTVIGALLVSTCLHSWAKKKLLIRASDIISKGHSVMLHNVVTKQVIFSGVYAVCALGYVFTSDIRETGTFRLNPMFLSGNFYMMIFLQLNTVRYLRYLVRAHLTPSLFLREAKLWKYLKDITDEAVAKRVMFNDSVQEINNPFDGSTKTTRRMSKIGKFSSIGQFHGLNHSVGSFGSTKKMSNPPSPPSSPSLTSLETGTTPPLDTFKSKSLSSRVRSKIKAKVSALNSEPRYSDGTAKVYKDWKAELAKMENDQSEGEKKALEMTDNPLNKESWRRKYSARSSISITKEGLSNSSSVGGQTNTIQQDAASARKFAEAASWHSSNFSLSQSIEEGNEMTGDIKIENNEEMTDVQI